MIRTAILLAAGEGSRLRGATPFKPLCPVAGVPLIDHALGGLRTIGIERVVVVLSYGADAIKAHLAARWAGQVTTVSSDHGQPNGVSVLAARPLIGGDALLAMCDHLVDPALYARVAAAGAGDGLALGVDRRIGHPWVDPLDVTCVRTRGDRIEAIGKGLEPHDCYDTGVFAVSDRLFTALASLPSPSLTQGVSLLAGKGRARVVDCSDLDWIDVDDPPALAHAEAWLAAGRAPALQRVAGGN